MATFATATLSADPDAIAPDGSEVRLLCRVAGGSMAHFRLPPGGCAKAVAHRTVEELWFVVAGEGEMWRRDGGSRPLTGTPPGTPSVGTTATVTTYRP